MNHLSEEWLMRLAEDTVGQRAYDKEEIGMMEHLKDCVPCYEKFCSALVLLEVTSEGGYAALSGIYGVGRTKKTVAQAGRKVLAAVGIVIRKLREGMDVAFEQAMEGVSFQFLPQPAMATRGMADSGNRVYKAGDMEDEKTFLAIDPAHKKLLLQVNAKKLGDVKINAYLKLASGGKIEIPLEMKGGGSIRGCWIVFRKKSSR